MPPVTFPQREMLRRLLDSGKLSPGEADTVRKLYDDIVAGRIGGLNHPQIVWAERLCRRCAIVPIRPGVAYGRKAREEQDKRVAEFAAMPRPKKPPGKR